MPDHGQVQLRLPVPPPSSPPDPRCGSPAAHLSLRRFAQGYVFGAPARLGPDPAAPLPASDSPATTATPPSPPYIFAAPAAAADFASCAARTAHDAAPASPARRPRPSAPNAVPVPVHPVETLASSPARGTPLPVRARAIERKPVQKRCRKSLSVDALADMFENVRCASDTASWRKAVSEKKRRVAGRRRTGLAAAFGVSLERLVGLTTPESPKEEVKTEKKSESISDLEDEDTADELSFLVGKCDLDAEAKQCMFMPYIT